MIGLFRALNDVNPNARNVVLTVLEGPSFGAKCFLSNGKLVWETADGFFSAHADAVRGIAKGDRYTIDGQCVWAELLGNEKKFVICGGGHISMPLIQMIRMLDCPVTVLEDREEYAENARQAGATQVICSDFADSLAQIEGDADTFFIIVTRAHQYDKICLASIVGKPHAYIGMIGSKRRVAIQKQLLIEEGYDAAVINSVYSPIGLDIGAETPEEIAIAIMAQIIQVRSASGRNSSYPKELLRAVVGHDGSVAKEPMVLSTIVLRNGSVPREVGTKMLVRRDSFVGTIGGGYAENEILCKARSLMEQGPFAPQLFHVDLSTKEAMEKGMLCGGKMDVLLEWVDQD